MTVAAHHPGTRCHYNYNPYNKPGRMTGIPERRLLAAIIVRAAYDLCQFDRPALMQDAAEYVAGDNFEVDCYVLGFQPDKARQWLAEYVAIRKRQMGNFTPGV
jgi:hypothetical protein